MGADRVSSRRMGLAARDGLLRASRERQKNPRCPRVGSATEDRHNGRDNTTTTRSRTLLTPYARLRVRDLDKVCGGHQPSNPVRAPPDALVHHLGHIAMGSTASHVRLEDVDEGSIRHVVVPRPNCHLIHA